MRAIERVRRGQELPSALHVEELVVLDRVPEDGDVRLTDRLPRTVECPRRGAGELELLWLGTVGKAGLVPEEQPRR